MHSLSFIRYVLFFLLLSVTAFANANSKSILIIGDSLSAGYGIPIKKGWVALLKKRIVMQGYDYKIINDSISGDTTSNGVTRIAAALKKYKPNLVIIELGGNDGLRGIEPTIMRRNLQKMVRLAKQKNASVILLAVPLPPNYGRAYIDRFLKVYSQVAKKENVAIVPNFLKNIGGIPNLMQPDGVHPNAKAQKRLLNNAWPVIKQNLESIALLNSKKSTVDLN